MSQTKNALVTGGAKRLGRLIALRLAEQGWNVAIHYKGSAAEARETCDAVQALGRKSVAIAADLAREDQTSGLIEKAREALGPIGLLVNNASVFEFDDLNSATRETWDLHIETNLRAPFVLSQAFAHQAEADGSIINIVDQRVFRPTPRFVTYSLSKASLHWLTTTLAQSLAPNIRVNAVAPGPSIIGARQSEEVFQKQREATLLGRGADLHDILDAISFLVSAKSVTGQTIAVDGGQHIAWQTPDVLIQE